MKQYKILTQKDDMGTSKESAAPKMEGILNTYAKDGWRVISCAITDIHAIASRHEFVAVLEKDV